jgi:hypothetical protein
MEIQVSPLVEPTVTTHATSKGGSYKKLEISYKDLSKDGKVAGKKMVSFNDEGTFNKVVSAIPGKVYNVRLEKDGDYWQWRSFEEALGEPAVSNSGASTPAVANRSSSSPATRISNYETAEERAARQRLIVRQSSITAAITLSIHNSPKNNVPIAEVLALASQFEAFVFGEGQTQDAVDPIDGLTNDIPE